jgi:hypothetical protein
LDAICRLYTHDVGIAGNPERKNLLGRPSQSMLAIGVVVGDQELRRTERVYIVRCNDKGMVYRLHVSSGATRQSDAEYLNGGVRLVGSACSRPVIDGVKVNDIGLGRGGIDV